MIWIREEHLDCCLDVKIVMLISISEWAIITEKDFIVSESWNNNL